MEARAEVAAPDAPRMQAGPNPQHLLTTVLGEYLDSSDAAFPSAAVVAVLGEFGISPASARAALSRLIRRGLVAVAEQGRTPRYHVTPPTIARHRSTMHHFLAFGAEPRQATGRWLMVAFSLPEPRQSQRHAVRKALGALGFARLYDSVWISPGTDPSPVRDAMRDLLDDVPGARWSVMETRFEDESGPGGPAAAYDLAGVAAAYRAFTQEHAGLRAQVRAGTVGPARALVARATLMDGWRRFALTDPDLPAHLLPSTWPRQAARATFLEVHTALGPLAQDRLVQLMTPSWPEAATWVTHYVAADDPHRGPLGGRR
ncbi:PaaX family transcriptional regulator [Cellulomonas phragmiteti]|uniref:PaaX family transcriptional regulator n=1 Tax=Cellulomonas phragmiteti TaxID=478780 RepID=A0ABQ4DJL2_9CELL|nr:PaaX family transcriptional regulator C-terminal domain-containing protein [Cellulomonas phragmiteti]GIG39508.1 PaaX family transcriptional regulator [Cellulomonas phragmiteti]